MHFLKSESTSGSHTDRLQKTETRFPATKTVFYAPIHYGRSAVGYLKVKSAPRHFVACGYGRPLLCRRSVWRVGRGCGGQRAFFNDCLGDKSGQIV